MTTTITQRLEIDAGHRLLNHEGKCRNYHGHRYQFLVTCAADELDAVGRVVDFSVVKARVGGWLDAMWDHGMVLQAGDGFIGWAKATGERQGSQLVWPKLYVLDCPPTAENLARIVFGKAAELLADTGVRVVRVVCQETPNCGATYEEPRND